MPNFNFLDWGDERVAACRLANVMSDQERLKQ